MASGDNHYGTFEWVSTTESFSKDLKPSGYFDGLVVSRGITFKMQIEASGNVLQYTAVGSGAWVSNGSSLSASGLFVADSFVVYDASGYEVSQGTLILGGTGSSELWGKFTAPGVFPQAQYVDIGDFTSGAFQVNFKEQ